MSCTRPCSSPCIFTEAEQGVLPSSLPALLLYAQELTASYRTPTRPLKTQAPPPCLPPGRGRGRGAVAAAVCTLL